MITARFTGKPIASVSVSGHAGFAQYGQDVVCAAVTSAVQLTANGLTEILKVPCRVSVLQDKIVMTLPENPSQEAEAFLEALKLHLAILAEDYPGTIQVIVSEV